MPKSFLSAKITRPILHDIVERKRLYRLMDRTVKKPVVWVSAPGGSGKTTLVAGWLDACRLPCLWYQVDEGDADIASFFYHMGLAGKKAAPRRRRPLPLLTPEHLTNLAVFTRRFFEELYGRLRPPFVIVLDNYQDAAAHSSFHDVISRGLGGIPAGITVIVISRTDPLPKFSRLRANGRIGVIGWDDLRFTLAETSDMVRGGTRKKLSQEMLTLVHDKTDGWAAGLVLLLEKARRGGITPGLIGRVARGSIFDYFAAEILDAADDKTKNFLLKTAFLPQVEPAVAGKLTGASQAGRILSNLSRGHFFTLRKSDPNASYQYHALFREYLLERAAEAFREEEIASIRKKASALLSAGGDFENATALSISAKDWPATVRLIRTHAPSLLSQGRSETVKDWLDNLPSGLVEADGDLLYFKGLCLAVTDPARGLESLEKAYIWYKEKGDLRGMLNVCSAAADNTIHSIDFASGKVWAARIEEIIERDPLLPAAAVADRLNLAMFNALAMNAPDYPDMPARSEWAFSIIMNGKEIGQNLRLVTAVNLSVYCIWKGDHARAKAIVDLIEHAAYSEDVSDVVRGSIIANSALYYFITGQPDRCVSWVEAGNDLASNSGVTAWQKHTMGHGISALLSAGNLSAAEAMFGEFSIGIHEAAVIDRAYYYLLSGWRCRIDGDLSAALDNVRKGRELFRGFLPAEILHNLVAAEYLFEGGRILEAGVPLARALEDSRSMNSRFFEHYCLLVSSRIALSQDDRNEGIRLLREAMALGRAGDYVNRHFWQADTMAGTCALALEKGIETDYVRNLIKRRNLTPDPPPLHIENWPWPLRIYTLGGFEIVKDDRPVAFEGKVQKMPLAMLRALVAFGGKEVTEEQLADALWPEAEGDAAHKSFDTTLHRLRKMIGIDNAITMKAGRLSLNPRYCWVDAAALDRVMELIERAVKKKAFSDLAHHADKLFSLYKGDFLAGVREGDFALSFRERERNRFLHIVLKTGDYFMEEGDLGKAAECFERGLEVDRLAEEFYQDLMTCHKRAGQENRAIRVYERCRRELAAVGLAPSSKTEAICSAIRKRQK
jgi:DNA-binding SARP family transcriptional activator